jgi:hypothetical protein
MGWYALQAKSYRRSKACGDIPLSVHVQILCLMTFAAFYVDHLAWPLVDDIAALKVRPVPPTI